MKHTYSNKYFDWILITITLLISIQNVPNLFTGFEFFSSYLLRIVFSLVSVVALLSLLIVNLNGERYTRFFIVVALIIPPLLIINIFLTDLMFYGANRLNLLQNPILFLKLIGGIVLLALTIKYSRKTKSERITDFGILIISVGVFAIVLTLVKTVQANMLSELNVLPPWKTIIKSIIGFVITYFGFRLKSGKTKLKTCIILVLIFMFIYGLI